MVKQGDIIKISFDPSMGHEEAKYRPGLVVSNDEYNDFCGGIVLVCPISHAKKFPLHIDLPQSLITDGMVLCEHIRALDVNARGYKYIETVPVDFIEQISEILKACVGIDVQVNDI